MIQLTDIHPLTGFLRDQKAHIERLSETGRPEVLTVNGRAKVVIQDAAAYQKMLDELDLAESTRIVQERLASIERGEPGVPAEEVFKAIRARLGINKP